MDVAYTIIVVAIGVAVASQVLAEGQ